MVVAVGFGGAERRLPLTADPIDHHRSHSAQCASLNAPYVYCVNRAARVELGFLLEKKKIPAKKAVTETDLATIQTYNVALN